MGRVGRIALALFVLAAGVRAVPVAVRGLEAHHSGGYHYYVDMAESVVAGEGLVRHLPYGHGARRANRTPLYPLVLAGFVAADVPVSVGVVLLGLLAGAASTLLAAAIALRLFGRVAALLAGLGVALWPHAVVHDTALQDTALYTALLLGAAHLAWVRADPAEPERGHTGRTGRTGLTLALGVVAGLAALTRVALLPTCVMLFAWTAWRVAARGGARSGLRVALVAVLAFGATLSPWLVRNALVLGRPVVTSDTGRSLWLGNNPHVFSVYPERSIDRAEEVAWSAVPDAEKRELLGRADDELASDAWFRARALRHVSRDPAGAVTGGLRKAWATFSPRMSPAAPPLKEAVHLGAYLPTALLAAAALVAFRRRWRELLPIPLAALLLAAQSAVFFGHSAYRLYLDPLLVVLAAGLVARWLRGAALQHAAGRVSRRLGRGLAVLRAARS